MCWPGSQQGIDGIIQKGDRHREGHTAWSQQPREAIPTPEESGDRLSPSLPTGAVASARGRMGSGDWLGLGHCSSPYRGPAPTLRRGAGTPAFRAVCSQAPGRLHFEPPGQAGPGQGPQHSGARDCAPAPLLLRGGAQRRSMRAGWQGLCQGPRTARLWGGSFPSPMVPLSHIL